MLAEPQADRARIKALVIAPAWQDVWICHRVVAAAVRLVDLGADTGWRDVTGAGLNEYRREIAGGDFSVRKTIARVPGELGRDLDFGELATRSGAERAVLRLLRGR